MEKNNYTVYLWQWKGIGMNGISFSIGALGVLGAQCWLGAANGCWQNPEGRALVWHHAAQHCQEPAAPH